jgi:NADPH-dependent curcumin reductase CurA
MAQGKDYYPALKRWYLEGRMQLGFDETVGIENVLDSFTRLMTGKNTGKVIVDVRS